MNNIIDSIQSCEQMEAFKKFIAPAESIISATKKQFVQSQSRPSRVPHNKKIEKQRRLFKTKKSINKKRSLTQPDAIQADNMAMKLLYPIH